MLNFNQNQHTFRSPKFESVVKEAISFFATTPTYQLSSLQTFSGAGVYGLYYTGSFDLYDKLAKANQADLKHPIYIGKAVAPGWRTARTKTTSGAYICHRLNEHTRSIKQVANLTVEDFSFRFMILTNVEYDLIVPVEAALIRNHEPLWNNVIDGFGNHNPGRGRYNQAPSEWDVLHPGRSWVARLTGNPPDIEATTAKVTAAVSQLPLL